MYGVLRPFPTKIKYRRKLEIWRLKGQAKDVKEALIKLSVAVGIKVEAAKLEEESKNMSSSPTKANVETDMTTQTDMNKALQDRMKEGGIVLDAAAKITYAQGLGFMGRGVTKYVALISNLKNFKPSVTSLGASAQSAVYLAQSLPGNMSNFSSTLSAAIEFAKDQNIPLPDPQNF